jgi:hypothetical protein
MNEQPVFWTSKLKFLCRFLPLHKRPRKWSDKVSCINVCFPRVTSLLSLHVWSYIHSSVICQTTGPQPLPKRFLHLMRSRAFSFKWQYPLLSPRTSSNCLRLLPRLLVTSIRPFIFPSLTSFRRRFLRKMWPIQLAFRFLISCRIFLCSLTLSNTSSFLTWSVQQISILLQHHISKLSRCFWSTARIVQVSAPYKAMLQM